MNLKLGDSGFDVEQLQLKLKAAGYDPGDIDGDFGSKTAAAVLAFQEDRPDLDDDSVVGPMTIGALNAAITKAKRAPSQPSSIVPCDAATWSTFSRFLSQITDRPVRYGPGRGLWDKGRFVVTYGPGSLGGTIKRWPNVLNKPFPSFHCTSWCNFFMSWLLRRNEDFTHAGNIPEIWELLLSSPDLHPNPGAGPYRGFGDVCFQIQPDGHAVKRRGVPKIMDMREVYDRRTDLPTFMVFGQSTKRASGWKWWHHTGVLAARSGALYRIAADGSRGASGYSGTPMRCIEVTPKNLADYDNVVYRVYGVNTVDGTYGDKKRPYASIDFEM